jgi:hypothetical protein
MNETENIRTFELNRALLATGLLLCFNRSADGVDG